MRSFQIASLIETIRRHACCAELSANRLNEDLLSEKENIINNLVCIDMNLKVLADMLASCELEEKEYLEMTIKNWNISGQLLRAGK